MGSTRFSKGSENLCFLRRSRILLAFRWNSSLPCILFRAPRKVRRRELLLARGKPPLSGVRGYIEGNGYKLRGIAIH